MKIKVNDTVSLEVNFKEEMNGIEFLGWLESDLNPIGRMIEKLLNKSNPLELQKPIISNQRGGKHSFLKDRTNALNFVSLYFKSAHEAKKYLSANGYSDTSIAQNLTTKVRDSIKKHDIKPEEIGLSEYPERFKQ